LLDQGTTTMNDPDYDFFGDGAGASAAAPAPMAHGMRPDRPEPEFVTSQGRVDRFGIPVGAPVVPTGPSAAAGIGARPTSTPGMVTTWQGPPMPARAAARAAAPDGAPTNVRAVAVLALVLGLLAGIVVLYGFSQYLALKSMIDQTLAAETPGGVVISNSLAGAVLTAVLISLLILGIVSAVLLVGGVATLASRPWGGWMLVGAFGLYVLGQVYSFAHGGYSLFGGVFLAIGVLMLLVLVTGDGRRWLLHG
jgi:hypothetical protein